MLDLLSWLSGYFLQIKMNDLSSTELVFESAIHNELYARNLLQYKDKYTEWYELLECNFNLLFHGFGSKIALIEDFVAVKYPSAFIVTLNGYSDNFNLSDVIDAIFGDILKTKKDDKTIAGQTSQIVAELKWKPFMNIVFVVHNFEKVQECNKDSEILLSKLSILNNVRLVCSVDHMNSLLQFSQTYFDRLNLIFVKAATFETYAKEIAEVRNDQIVDDFEKKLNQIKGIYQAFNDNSKKIFVLIVKEYLENFNQYAIRGLNMHEFFYSNVKNDLIITFDTFRIKLLELADQKLVEIKNEHDLTEQIVKIPFSKKVLGAFLDTI